MGSFSFLKHDTHMHVLWTILSYVSSQFLIMYNRAHTFLLPWILCECVRHLRESSRWRLTADLSWSESMRPCDRRENRGIKHYHQKRLQFSLLWPHSFLQSSWWFVCLLVVPVWMVPLFESMHFSAPIICWGRRRAGKKKKKKSWEQKGEDTTCFPILLNQYSDCWSRFTSVFVWMSEKFIKSESHLKTLHLTAALLLGIEASRDIFLPIIQLWCALVGTGTHNANVVRKKTYHCGEVCLILLRE